MALDIGDQLSLKNILFDKAMPNYTIPVPTNGYKIFTCSECGDTFIFESSYYDHINRKSLNITFFCRHCNKIIICNNRCKFLSHIKTHMYQTTAIDINNLKIEPLPLENVNWTILSKNNNQVTSQIESQVTNEKSDQVKERHFCFECKQIIERTGKIEDDRAKHYMKYANTLYSCPICLYALPNSCSLMAHMRIHLKIPPYYCTECGIQLSIKNVMYPYNHDCKGFDMIKASTRVKCNQQNCDKIFHPCDYRKHIKNHIKKIYKCAVCSVIWDEKNIINHLACKNNDKITLHLECGICSNKLINKMHINSHINLHFKNTFEKHTDNIYPCMSCSVVCNEISSLIKHQINEHIPKEQTDPLFKILNQYDPKFEKNIHCITKKCGNCSSTFLYASKKSLEIQPTYCPYKCYTIDNINTFNSVNYSRYSPITCCLCKLKISENWQDIKKHFAKFHKKHKCLDMKVTLKRIDKRVLFQYIKCKETLLSKITTNYSENHATYIRKSKTTKESEVSKDDILLKNVNSSIDRSNENILCSICNLRCQNKLTLETHIITHRDPCMAYQCLECGQCFAVKPSFSTHLLLEHGIENVAEYINKKTCYNQLALLKLKPNNMEVEDKPLEENQCGICRDQFENTEDLEKHFRVHGMAFLMKNTYKNQNS